MSFAFAARRVVAALLGVALVAGGATVLAGSVVAGAARATKRASDDFLALPARLHLETPPQRSALLAADGTPFAYFWDENRQSVRLNQVSPWMRKAIVAIEDARFYDNNGIDLRGIARAALSDTAGGDVQGASTLTQQLVKNSLLERARTPEERRAATEPTLQRKLQEARYALSVAGRLSKDAILERYLNLVFFGSGAYGVQAAAETYFHTNAVDLTLPQAAFLAGIVRNPSLLDPKATLLRRNTVLDRMAELGEITPAQQAAAKRRPLGLRPGAKTAGCYGSDTGYFCDWVRRQLLQDPALGATPEARRDALYRGGLRIRTTLDRKVSAAAVRAVRPARGSRAALATAVVQPGSGKVLALAASVPFGVGKGASTVNLPLGGSSGFQSGSTFKVFVLTQAIQDGLPLDLTLYAPHTYASRVFARDGSSLKPGAQPYVVSNAADSEDGRFTLEQATWLSVNTYYLQLEERVGIDGPARIAESMGVRLPNGQPLHRVPSFTLGTNEVTPLAMSAAYATYAAHGLYCAPMGIDAIQQGQAWRARYAPQCKQVLDRQTADTVTQVLRGVIARGTGTAARIGSDAAGKTGTVQDFSAAWFVGYTPDLAAAVWLGDPRGGYRHPLRNLTLDGRHYRQVYGGQVPAQAWAALMRAARPSPPASFTLQPRPSARPRPKMGP